MFQESPQSDKTLARDVFAGLIVFLVALPLCLGVALASNTPLIAGLVSGIIGGIIAGLFSGSHTSVSGPSPGQVAVILAQVSVLGSFEVFLMAVLISGITQILMGVARLGGLSAFVPTSVIQGLLSAIGVILFLKQIPHILGHDTDPEGEMSFQQPDQENTFSEILNIMSDLHLGAAVVGVTSLVLLISFQRVRFLKNLPVPAPLAVVLFGVSARALFDFLGSPLAIGTSHLVEVPVADSIAGFFTMLRFPDFGAITRADVWFAGTMIALMTSLETLLNLEAVDKIDPKKRKSPADRELVVQGVCNILAGLLGGLPVSSVIVRSSVNINAGAQTRLSAIVHGVLLGFSVVLLPGFLNSIPISCLAAILLMTGMKLASPSVFRNKWLQGKYQFLPFIVTVLAIIFTDLMTGVLIGLVVSLAFVLYSNLKRPVRIVMENHLGGEVMRIELANQVSFLNKASLERTLNSIPKGTHVLLDARQTYYIDSDMQSMIREFRENAGSALGLKLSMVGFREKYQLQDDIQFVDYSSRELQSQITPEQVLEVFREGNERFRTGSQITRDLGRQMNATSSGQHPIAVVLSCIDSRTPAELIFDLGLGDIFSIRLAGNVLGQKVLGSMEYGTAVAGAKMILVVGHTRCGAVTAAVNFAGEPVDIEKATGCQHLEEVLSRVQLSMKEGRTAGFDQMTDEEKLCYVDNVARRNVIHVVQSIVRESRTIEALLKQGQVAVVGAMYDVETGRIEFLIDDALGITQAAAARPGS